MFLAVFTIAVSTFFYIRYQSEVEVLLSYENGQTRLGQQVINDQISDVINDLKVISASQNLQDFLTSNDEVSLQKLGNEFLNFSCNKKLYDQIRFLDSTGQERSRANYNNGNCKLVETEKLQNKARRYYFIDAFKLDKGNIFISPLDLNIENGHIEKPLKPMIRIGTPVFDNTGVKRGVLLINYLAKHTIEKLSSTMIGANGNSFMLNKDGYFLHSLHKKDNFGFMFKNKNSFSSRYPLIWRNIKNEDNGQLINESGIFTWNTVYPLVKGSISSDGAVEPFQSSNKTFGKEEYFWKVGTHIPAETIQQIVNEKINQTIFLIFLLSPIALISSYLISRIRSSEKITIQALQESEQLQKAITTDLAEGLMVLDLQGKVITINPEAEKLLGLQKEDSIQPGSLGLLHQALIQEIADLTIINVTRSGESVHIEDDSFNRADGKSLPVSYTASPYYKDDQVQGVIVAFEDISERKQLNEKLTKLAMYDELTGLYNRREIENLIKHTFSNAQRYDKPMCVCMVDIDFFKEINDKYGHQFGDKVLRETCGTLKSVTRKADASGRYGGEEFIVLLNETTLEGAYQWCEVFRKKVEQQSFIYEPENLSINISISAGVAINTNSMDGYETLINNADKRLYQAKKEGRNRVCGFNKP